jgi:hypothetical protein
VLGSAASIPLLPSSALAELLAFGQQARAAAAGLTRSDPWLPGTLDPHQDRTVTAIAEVILPETETPGATTARVNEFVDLILTDWFTVEDRDRFLTGLDDVDVRTRADFGLDFVECSPEQRIATLAALDAEVEALRDGATAARDERRGEGEGDGLTRQPTEHFFYQMKRLTLAGFFTSEIGMGLLGYQIVPGPFEGCMLLDQYAGGGGS